MISFQEPIHELEKSNAILGTLQSGQLHQGPQVAAFEKSIAHVCEAKHGIATCNGTTALHLALAACGVTKGMEVIVPSFTFIATANAVAYTGATPVFADISKEAFGLDSESVEKAITSKTKAIIAVHVYGYPCDIDPLREIAQKHNLVLIEDAAESIGATYKSNKVGSLSDIGCFSFYANKILSTGEGGMCTTNSDELAEKMRMLRSQGKVKSTELKGSDIVEKRYFHSMLGFNYRMTDMQAAVGNHQLPHLSKKLEKRKEIATKYKNAFKQTNVEELTQVNQSHPVYWVYPLIFKNNEARLQVGIQFQKENIPFLSAFWSCHKQPFYEATESLPVTENISQRVLTIPCNATVSDADIEKIANILKKHA